MSEPGDSVRSVFGWCRSAPGAKPDQHHNLCHVTYRSGFGVEHTCSCPQHANDEPKESAD